MTPPRYTELAFPAYRFLPGAFPHPHRDPRGHSYGSSPTPTPWRPETWPELVPYLFAVDLYNHGYWWEAHEAWESLWRAADRGAPESDYLQGLIHVAAAALQRRRGREAGALRQAGKALSRLARVAPDDRAVMGVRVAAFAEAVHASFVESRDAAPPQLVLELPRSLRA